MFKKIVLSIVAFLGIGLAAFAQNQISGTVVDASGAPMAGVAVFVEGTNTGAVTDLDGHYAIKAEAQDVLSFTFFGMKEQKETVGARTVINVTLSEDTLQLDEVVVTALGITKSEKSLGYSATTIKNEELTAARGNNAIAAVAGKVAGVQVSSSATTAGAAQSVVIRGFSSIGNSNQPLYVIDGVPMQSLTVYNTKEGYGNLGSGVGSINNDDIESMTILKGAAATALYGSRASGGVVVITTKSGKNKNKTEIAINAGVQFSNVSTLPEFQNKFGTGWDGSLTLDENGSWGPAFNNQLRVYGPVIDNTQRAKVFKAMKNNVRDFYETGVQYNTSVSITGGNENTGYYASYSNVKDDGILPRNKDTYDKNTLSFRGSHQAYKWLSFESSVNFSIQETDQVSEGSGQQSILEGMYQAGRDISFIDGKDLSDIFNNPEGWYTPYGITNPYWIIDNSYNRTNIKKLFGKLQTNITPMEQLTLTYRYGFDYSDYDSKLTMYQIAMDPSYANSSSTNQEGSIAANYGRYHEINHDFLANWKDKYFNDKFDVNVTVGANINERGNTSMGADVTGLTFDTGFWDLSNTSSKPNASESQLLRRSVGVFADAQLGWADQVYLDVTARNDWSSTLPKDNNSYFYPGATLSWIFTNTFNLGDAITFGKLRAAYGKTGNDPSAYLTEAVYTQGYSNAYLSDTDLGFPFNGYNGYMATASLASGSLQPEMTTEMEFGANILFFNGRIGIDAAYYDRTSDMQIFKLPSDPATGYTSMVVNFGQVRNHGVELLLTTTPIKTKNFQWDVDFNWAKNYNKVVSLPDGLDGGKSRIVGYDDVYTYAEVGRPLGTIYTTLPQYTEDGKIICNEDGLPIQSTDRLDTGLDIQNKWTGGISTSLRYKNLSASATIDARFGGYMYSRTKTLLWFTGNSIENTYNDRRAFVVPNSVIETDDGYIENNVPITLYSSSYQYFMNGNNSYPLEGGLCKLVDRTYAKLRDVSISYDLPAKWINPLHLKAVRLSAVGSNLYLWTPKSNCYIDPDQGYTTDLSGGYGEIDCTVPCRYFGFNVQVKF